MATVLPPIRENNDVPAPAASVPAHGSEHLPLVERIANSEPFQKSSRLPVLLRYLATCTLQGDRAGLTEQAIGRAVFEKTADFSPTEDSSVRVYVRQLRLRLYEYFQSAGADERTIIEIPKGGYALAFQPRHVLSSDAGADPTPTTTSAPAALEQATGKQTLSTWFPWAVVAVMALVAIAGWTRWYRSASVALPPWPLNEVVDRQRPTTVVLADVSYVLRLLGDRQVTLDEYVDHKYTKGLIPENASRGELSLFHYLQDSQITSMTDARAASVLTLLAGSLHDKLVFRSAKEVNGETMLTGNFIIVGAKNSNPWVELYEPKMNFRFIESGPHGSRYIDNRVPRPGEQAFYAVHEPTGYSGEDYATISVMPSVTDQGSTLLVQGLRREGTEAAIQFLNSASRRDSLATKLRAANGGRLPKYFEALIQSHAVAGSATSIDCIAVHPLHP
ncbi:hypothetical protein [Terriglobus roseus]|uniref:Transcriptional regulatory protein, C terminal n=1 Tax=Terriglobus roseus TaxID=392734 RepID=A0A1G7JD65_9BACT|nr:hypothetical protein [Terriglobus roseus]SDF22882.1 hypothetical protein SAMN05444167_1779 [Terriglobus roseus]